MRHFFRSSLTPAQVVAAADDFFAGLSMTKKDINNRTRSFSGELGELTLSVRPEGGHYTFVEADTDQMGESRLDRNVKRFFVQLHRMADPRHRLEAAY
jgi:hypothetical protein